MLIYIQWQAKWIAGFYIVNPGNSFCLALYFLQIHDQVRIDTIPNQIWAECFALIVNGLGVNWSSSLLPKFLNNYFLGREKYQQLEKEFKREMVSVWQEYWNPQNWACYSFSSKSRNGLTWITWRKSFRVKLINWRETSVSAMSFSR